MTRHGGASDSVQGLGRVEQLVLRGDGLTTTSMEILTGERVSVHVVRHWILPLHGRLDAFGHDETDYTGVEAPDLHRAVAVAHERLDVDEASTLLVREIVHRGDSGRHYGASTVVAALDRLDPLVARGLAETDEPIGRMLAAHHIPVRRELIRWGRAAAGALSVHLSGDISALDPIPSREYVMHLVDRGRPLAALTEWFAPSLFVGGDA